MKVGILIASISRRAGGLFWSVRSLAHGVKQAGCSVQVFSIADRYSDEDAAQWGDVDIRLLSRRGPPAFGYAPGFGRALDQSGPDILHTHGLWMYPSLAAWRWSRRWNRPLVISPRGMLDPWAVRNAAWKKRIAGWLYENVHLRGAACLHALCESEYQAFRAYGLSNPVAIIPNGVDVPEADLAVPEPKWAPELPADARVLFFLSRIHPKKGLANLLQAWARARRQQPDAAEPWRLVIAGWDQGDHQAELERLCCELEIGESVHFVGPQFDEDKASSLAHVDAFILPSFSEGLPMAVLEAWSYRLPVLMTPQCNLPEGFRTNAALEMAPETRSIADALGKLFAMSETERRAMGGRGRELVEMQFTWPMAAGQMVAVYDWILGGRAQPGCVITD